MSIFSKILKISVLVLSILSVQVIFAASDDDYLKQLDMEADNDISDIPAILNSEQPELSNNGPTLDAPSSEMELIIDKKELIVDNQSFEKAMEGAYPESFALYVELTGGEKKQVYQNFTEKKRLFNSSLKIISIYLASH